MQQTMNGPSIVKVVLLQSCGGDVGVYVCVLLTCDATFVSTSAGSISIYLSFKTDKQMIACSIACFCYKYPFGPARADRFVREMHAYIN
jgi:hypothetical protein